MNLQPILIFLVTTSLYCVNAEIHWEDGVPHTKLANGGLVSGSANGGLVSRSVMLARGGRQFSSFIGIPNAIVPERFHEPQPITQAPWTGVLNATTRGPVCSQSTLGSNAENILGDENCLNLNVHVPITNSSSASGKGLPVMVFIHGGGFIFGSGSGYGAKYLMEEDVIIITLNYRLGLFGFLSTGDNVVPGNNGLKNIVTAFKWVRDNVKNFGGDPSTVTLFGESAGSVAVHYLHLSPTAKGLFYRAIAQSGSAMSLWGYQQRPKETAVELATHMNCKTTASEPSGISSEEILTCLKAAKMEDLMKAQTTFKSHFPMNLKPFDFTPTSEPETPVSDLTPFLTKPPTAIVNGNDTEDNRLDIPLIAGVNEDEGYALYAAPILSQPKVLEQLNSNWEEIAPKAFDYSHLTKKEQAEVSQKFRKFYFGDKPISLETKQALTDLYSDSMFVHGVYKSVLEAAKRGHKLYLYVYTKHGPVSLAKIFFKADAKTASHGDELFNLFEAGDEYPGTRDAVKPNTRDEEFSKNFVRLWTSFAIHGEPTHTWENSSSKKWEPISKDILGSKYFKIDENPENQSVEKRVQERMQLWDELWSQYFGPAQAQLARK